MIFTDDLWAMPIDSDGYDDSFGDEPRWQFWTPEVLRRIGGARTCAMPMVHDTSHDHSVALRVWGPLLPLLRFHLGWPWVDLGLARWSANSFNDFGDPTLRVVNEIWGPALPAFTYWYLSTFARRTPETVAALRRLHHAREAAMKFGPNDELHLSGHYLGPIKEPEQPRHHDECAVLQVKELGRASLVLPRYLGWYRLLTKTEGRLHPLPGDRSWRIDVTIVPIGYIGQFRKSRSSSRWFSGRHKCHALGIDDASPEGGEA